MWGALFRARSCGCVLASGPLMGALAAVLIAVLMAVPTAGQTAEPIAAAPGHAEGCACGAECVCEDECTCAEAADECGWNPEPTHVWGGNATSYEPLNVYEPGGTRFVGKLMLTGRGEQVSEFPLDRFGTMAESPAAFNGLVRASLSFSSQAAWAPIGVGIDYEHDIFTGTLTDAPGVAGEAMPYTEGYESQLRKASLRLSIGPWVHLLGGYMLNTWGMGLLANAGDQLWMPGSARFLDQRGGDRVLRGAIMVGPFFDWKLRVVGAYDIPQDDNSLLSGDDAHQFIGSVMAGDDTTNSAGGVFVVHRRQDNDEGRGFAITAIDMSGRTKIELGTQKSVTLETEMVLVTGTSDFSPSPDHPDKDVLQFGAAARANFDLGGFGAVIDFLYASGDPNYDDGSIHAFRANRNYEFGLLLFRHVMAAQTGRAYITAADPELLGIPPDDLDRLATRGSPSNTIAFFPRAWVQPVDGLEIFGGPLIALAAVPYSDPLNTRLGGGTLRGPLDAVAHRFLGVEVDLGIRYRTMMGGTELTFGLEGGVLIPGAAFQDAGGSTMDTVYGGRSMITYRL